MIDFIYMCITAPLYCIFFGVALALAVTAIIVVAAIGFSPIWLPMYLIDKRKKKNSGPIINEQPMSKEEEKEYWAWVVIATLISPILGLLALSYKKKQ